MTESAWVIFLREVSNGASAREVAKKVGVSEATVSRWLSDKTNPRPRQIVAVARAYGVSPLDALVAAGELDGGDLDVPVGSPRGVQIRQFTTVEIVEEIHRRSLAGELD